MHSIGQEDQRLRDIPFEQKDAFLSLFHEIYLLLNSKIVSIDGITIIVKRKVATMLMSVVSPACCQPLACGTRTRSTRLEGTMIKAPTCVMAIASGHALSARSLLDPATNLQEHRSGKTQRK